MFSRMKKLLVVVALLGAAACHQGGPSGAPAPVDRRPGGATPDMAVSKFLAAVHAQDLQAMATVWGTAAGPALDNMPRAELEKREVVLQCYFDHDSAQILGNGISANGQRSVRVRLTRDGRTHTTTFFTVPGPDHRWYVQDMDIAAVRDFCGLPTATP